MKLFLSNNFKLALNLRLDGAYIPAFNKSLSHLNYSLYKNFITIGSAHNIKEIRIKEKQNVEQIFLSPLFETNKSKTKLGIIKFNNLSRQTNKPLVALGGISKKNIKQLKLINISGFAGISYFNKTITL